MKLSETRRRLIELNQTQEVLEAEAEKMHTAMRRLGQNGTAVVLDSILARHAKTRFLNGGKVK